MKITMYELLGMIKDGKAPKKFKHDIHEWVYNYESSAYWNGKGIEFEDYMDDGLMKYLNDTVEIIEEEKKIPEKLIEPIASEYTYDYAKKICHKINEIIDYLKSKGE